MSDFTPLNDLEVAMLGAPRSEEAQQAFLAMLMDAEVGVLLDRPLLEGGKWDPEAAPLVLNRPGGFPALAVFTAPQRAISAGVFSEVYQWGTSRVLRQLLRGVQPVLGLVVNPGTIVGFDIAPADLAELKAAFGVETVSRPA